MWVDSRERLPKKDGDYMYQSVYGIIGIVQYTIEGGWNTHRSPETGRLWDNLAIENDGYIARWFDAPDPDPIPEEWLNDYYRRKENERRR